MESSKVLHTWAETPAENVTSIYNRALEAFHAHKTQALDFRIRQLRKLYWAIDEREDEIRAAIKKDLNKSEFEIVSAEIGWIKNDIIFVTNNLKTWAKDEKPKDISLSNSVVSPRIRKVPLGVVLVIGPFNFPFQLALGPVIGAIAGGNTVVLKPSESAPYTSAVIQKVIEASLDPDCYAVVQGAIPQTKALLGQKWDKIFFTGSVNTAKIVAKAAAVHLTPCVFELGGKNPAIVTRKADLHLAARRLLWAKTMNAGQVCLSHNYTLVERDVLPTFVEELKGVLNEFFPRGTKNSADYGRIINLKSFQRLKKMLDDSKGKILIGGETDAEQLYFEPTVVEVTDPADSLLAEESFGPLLPIVAFDNLDKAIAMANSIHDTPLGTYIFGDKSEADKVAKLTRSGGLTHNDAMFHGIIPTMEFGGVGDSGHGSYRGKASFDTFVHRRAIAKTPNWMERFLAVRYPPVTIGKLKQYAAMAKLKPNFDRDGNDNVSTVWYILTLGSKTISGALARVLMFAALVFGYKRVQDSRAN
jgi:beta-apo-4'-carotenal oxygenase